MKHDYKLVLSTTNTLFYIWNEGCRWLDKPIVKEIKWIEKELTKTQELFEQVRLCGYGGNKPYFKEWEKDLKNVTSDIEKLIEKLMKTRSSAMTGSDKREIYNYLSPIRRKILQITSEYGRNPNPNFVISVESLHEEASSSSTTTSSQLLDDEASWTLFTGKLKVGIAPKSKLMEVGKEIVMKCGGLEAQISKMCDLLSHQDVPFTHEAWTKVLEGPEFNKAQTHNWSKTIQKINKEISHQLRTCLFYFVYFPIEFGIPVRRLVVLWVAEGLISDSEGEKPIELVAQKYLEELIDSGMVQVAKRKPNGKVKTCRLPSALRQLWLTKTYDFRTLQNHTTITPDSNAKINKKDINRVADRLYIGDIWKDHIHGDSTDSTTLRTYYKNSLSFLSFDTREGSNPGQEVGNFLKGCISSDCFLHLRVLDLEGVYKPKLPKRIKRLTQLRYLGLRWTYLESLPSSIRKLLRLQTLDLKHTYIHTLPTSIWKTELRHLFLSETYRTKFPPQPLGNSLSDLQTLSGLFIDEETQVENGLDKLVNITKLGLACQSMSLEPETMMSQLKKVAHWITKLKHLQSLRLKSRDEEGKPWILPLPPFAFANKTNLIDIYLLGSLSSSSLSELPVSLVELTLSHSKLKDDPMKLLKDLPNLQTLCLLAESYAGTAMVCEPQSFPKLHVLKFWKLKEFDIWIIQPGALRSLRELEIRWCPKLKSLPYGLKQVNTLLELKLRNMPKGIKADEHNIPPDCQVYRKDFE